MDYVTQVLDAAKLRNGWSLESDQCIRNNRCECPLIAAHRYKDLPIWRSNGVYDLAAADMGLSLTQAITIATAADYDYPTYSHSNFNPFLRDRLCLELVGGWE